MSNPTLLDKAFHVIMKRMVETGQAPFYTELASELGLSMEDGRKTLHDLFTSGIPGWLYPRTDHIVSFAPFNNLPTQYRITAEGQQKWFGQWAFESLAVCWLFPGKKVTIDFPCLDCGQPLRIILQDGQIQNEQDTAGYMTYVSVPRWKWFEDASYAWSTMNCFRSEAHVRNWASYVEGTDEGLTPLSDMMKLFSGPSFKRRLDPDYVSHMVEYAREMVTTMKEINKTGPFWKRPK